MNKNIFLDCNRIKNLGTRQKPVLMHSKESECEENKAKQVDQASTETLAQHPIQAEAMARGSRSVPMHTPQHSTVV